MNHVLKATVYIADISLWAKVNEVYARTFGDHKPARAAVPTKDLPGGLLVEIDVIAALA
jgi:2-iminobutanoate/2-iminopropanoate deaminase